MEPGGNQDRHIRGELLSTLRYAIPPQPFAGQMPHLPESLDIRGGATTADHIDILGSTALNEILLKVAAGASDEVQDHFVSVREASFGSKRCLD